MSETPQEKEENSGGEPENCSDEAQGDQVSLDEEEKEKSKEKFANAGTVVFGKGIEINPSERLKDYDVGDVKAYRAVRQGKKTESFVALVCVRHLVPRVKSAVVYEKMFNDALIRLVDFGIVYWGLEKQERYVFIYEDTLGKRLLEVGAPMALGWKQDSVMKIVVDPIVSALVDFRDRDFFHGAIRPDNMFNADKTSKLEKAALGDCLSVPASCAQPILFEPIERSMVDPVARGSGTQRDDLYAFGASLAVLMRTTDSLGDVSDTQIIRQKIENGSYLTITGKDRFTGSILELLRGLLHDDPLQRWTIDEVLTWLDGRRLSPKQAYRQKKAPRAIDFMGDKYFYIPFLAMDIGLDPAETFKIVENEELLTWLERSVEDEETTFRVEEAQRITKEAGVGPGYQDRLAANLSSALDPMAPIRYKGLRLNGDGVGTALAETMVLKQDSRAFADIFKNNVAMNWITGVENPNLDIGALVGKFDSCRGFLSHTKVGFGIERCVYVLCSEVHCLSEKLERYFVTTPEFMMDAFEDMCKRGQSPAFFLDNHSIAFLSVKDPKCVDFCLYDLGSSDEHRKILGNLKCLASIQKRGRVKFPEIAKAFVEMLPVVYEHYHDANIRAKMEKEVSGFAAAGDLVKMAALLSNPQVKDKDANGFKFAMNEYSLLRQESKDLAEHLSEKAIFGRGIGREVSAVISCIFSSMVMLAVAVYFMSDKSVF